MQLPPASPPARSPTLERLHFRTREGIDVPAVTADTMRAVDRVAMDAFGIDLLQMMENAGRALSDIALTELGMRARSAVVLAGAGGNGGGGLSALRHMHNRGIDVSIVLDRSPSELQGAGRRQLDTLLRSHVEPIYSPRTAKQRIQEADIVIHALVGYGLEGELRPPTKALVELANEHARAVLALDVPTGVHATSGTSSTPSIRPIATVTLALPKTGLANPDAHPGKLYLTDLGIPRAVFQVAGLDTAPYPYTDRGWTVLDAPDTRAREGAHRA